MSSRMVNDQHQPASSRAIAALATTGRLLARSKPVQRVCRRWLAACPRARADGLAASQRRRRSRLGRYGVRRRQADSTSSLAGVAVTGLSDPTLDPGGPRGVLQDQTQVGADRTPTEPGPVTDLSSQPNAVNVETPRRQLNRATTGVNSESAAIAAIASSKTITAMHAGHHRVQRGVIGQLANPRHVMVLAPQRRRRRSSCSR